MKKDMETLIEIGNMVFHELVQVKDDIHSMNKIAIGVMIVNIITLGLFAVVMLRENIRPIVGSATTHQQKHYHGGAIVKNV